MKLNSIISRYVFKEMIFTLDLFHALLSHLRYANVDHVVSIANVSATLQ